MKSGELQPQGAHALYWQSWGGARCVPERVLEPLEPLVPLREQELKQE